MEETRGNNVLPKKKKAKRDETSNEWSDKSGCLPRVAADGSMRSMLEREDDKDGRGYPDDYEYGAHDKAPDKGG